MADSISTFPGDCVVLIESPVPNQEGSYFIGSGVVIGPHTILTASHVVYDTSEQTPDQNIVLYPGWDNTDPELGSGYISTTYTDHYYELGTYGSDSLTKAQSASDFAIIDTSYTFTSWMGVVTNYQGGAVTATGYPATAGGYQTTQVGTVSADPSYSVLDYDTLSVSAGNSGGPLWLDYNGSDDLAGIVSTTGWACQLTTADWSQIESWVSQDGYSLGSNTGPVVTAVPSVSIGEGQSIAASSLIASVSNPNGDAITEDIYEDLGGGSGYFTVNGAKQPDSVWIDATPSEDVQYVAGSSPGSDTLGVGIYDATTNSNFSTSTIATTIHVAPVVTAVPSVSIGTGQSIAASSLMSISNPSGDDILEDIYEDEGGGSGYFTVDGVTWTDGIPIYATPSEGVQYVGGSSSGSDTLIIGIFDLTTDSYIYASNPVVATTIHVAPVVTAVSNVSLTEGQSIPASSLIASVSNPSGDDVTEDLYEDAGGGSGYFAVNGIRQADGVWIGANSSEDVQYVGGSSPGSDTLSIGVFDLTTDSYIYASNSIVATTTGNASDIVWRNASTAGVELWTPNGSGGFTYESLSPVSTSWQVAGTGDFTGSGDDGILWRNASTGGVELWNPNRSGGFNYQSLNPVNTSWLVSGTGDFIGSGDDGILWRNASTGGVELWNSNGSGGFTYEALNPVNTSWQVAGTGDFTGSGDDGILWRNASTGGVELWNPNGSGGFTYEALNPVNTNWQVAGTGDFTGSGDDGILWRNASTGGVELWNPNGSGGFTYEALNPVNTNWQVAGTGDFTGSGDDGILWRNASTGGVELWNPNGSGGFAYDNLGVVSTSWTVAGHL